MSSLTSLLYKREFTPLLKPGQNVRVEPVSQFGYYTLPRSAVPEKLIDKDINLASFASPLQPMSDSGSSTPIRTKITQLDVGTLQIAHYRLFAKDPDVRFLVFQPGTTARFANKDGAIGFDQGSTLYHIENQNWSQLPELFLYEDKTPITIEAYSENMDESLPYARFTAFGFKYPLALKEMPIDKVTREPLEPIAVTIRVSERV